MKKNILFTAILTVILAVAANAFVLAGGSVKIMNDTDADVQIHTGSGFVEINKTSSTSVSCEPGKVISLAEKGKKKAALFTIDDSMCNKTVKLSKYL